MYLGDDTGVYTDTAEFVDIIPECTNISVGYDNEHSDRETLDIFHFTSLAAAAVKIKWDALPVARDPTVIEKLPLTDWRSYYSTTSLTSWDGKWSDASVYGYTESDMLEDALRDALRGMHHDLLDMIAEAAYPEDPMMALKFLNKRMLTDEVLQQAMTDCAVYDADTVLLSLFDTVHCEV
jgi:hypothetical protein